MSAVPPAGSWITPPPSDDGAAVWSSEEYSTITDSGYLPAAGYGRKSATSSYAYAGAYPYYSSHDESGRPLPPYWRRPVRMVPFDGFAIASLVFGIVGIWFLGIG